MKLPENPFLPKKKVKYIIANNLNESGKKYFYDNGINVIELPKINSVDKRINYHADLFCLPMFDRLLFCNELSGFKFPNDLKSIDMEYLDCNLSEKYPGDVLLNCVFIDKYLICNIDTVSDTVLQYIKNFDDFKVINVKQGYTKCSVCPVSKNAFVTDDETIFENCKDIFDVLFIEKGSVFLDGFDYGFIGGAGGKIDKDKLAFTGKFSDDLIERKIITFCKKHNVECIWLSDEPIYDIGSIIPLTEV